MSISENPKYLLRTTNYYAAFDWLRYGSFLLNYTIPQLRIIINEFNNLSETINTIIKSHEDVL